MSHHIRPPFFLALRERKSHVFAGVIVFQDTNAHPLIGGQILELLGIEVVKVIHAHGQLVRVVIRGVADRDFHPRLLQLFNHIVGKTAAPFPPEFNADRKFVEILLASVFRQRFQQELHIGRPSHSFREFDFLPSQSRRVAIPSGESDTVYPVDHLSPHVRVYYPVQLQTRERLRQERARHALTVQRNARLIVEVVKAIIVPFELSVRRPHIRRQPVVNRIGIVNSGGHFTRPRNPTVLVDVFVAVNAAPPVKTLLRANAHQATRPGSPLFSREAIPQNGIGTHSPTCLR